MIDKEKLLEGINNKLLTLEQYIKSDCPQDTREFKIGGIIYLGELSYAIILGEYDS